jgi:polysaccharide pyruvyl transferase WcaK-like protein
VGQGHHILLFPNAVRARHMDRLRNNDLPVIRDVIHRLAANGDDLSRLTGIDCDINTRSIKRLIQACDLVLVSRFHAMIAALCEAVPVIVLGWSHKYLEVMEPFGMADKVFDYQAFSSVELTEMVTDTLARRTEISARIESNLPEIKALAQTQLDCVFSILEDQGARE